MLTEKLVPIKMHLSYTKPVYALKTNTMTIQEIWNLPIHEFNDWREKNDITKLFKFFKCYLPDFEEWMEQQSFDLDLLIKNRNPGEFFQGNLDKYLIETPEEHIDNRYFFVEHRSWLNGIRTLKIAKNQKQNIQRFTPYFKWGKSRFGKPNFVPTTYSGDVSTFRYTSGTAPDSPELCSWVLLSGITVLKLGGITLEDYYPINGRNLDFTNLDFLEIKGKNHGNVSQPIFYSHCRNIKLTNAEVNFFNFFECYIENLKLENESSLYSTSFIGGHVWNLHSKNSAMRNLSFYDSSILNFNLENTFIEDISYKPLRIEWHNGKPQTLENISDNYKRFRICYVKQGSRKEIKESYYFERKYSMLSSFSKINSFNGNYRLTFNLRHSYYAVRNLTKDIFRSIKYLLKSLADLFNFSTWGFGEKPHRLIFFSIVVILTFSVLYRFFDITKTIFESIYFSVFSFIRVGGNDLTGLSNGYKLIIGSEALIGWMVVVLLINGYANKTRY